MPRNTPPDRSERGFTLLEVLVTVSLLSIAFIGILGAVSAMITAGAENANAAASENGVRNLAAFMQLPAQAYVPCGVAGAAATAYTTEITAGGFVAPSGFAPSVTGVQAWNGDSPATFVATPDGTCPAAGGDHNLELLTLTLTPNGTSIGAVAPRTLTILKRP